MLMNRVETMLVNSPPRGWLQRYYETPLLLRMGGRLHGGHVLEVGCGRGVGTQLILERFGAARVTAFDLDPDMIRRARRRLARYGGRVALAVGDAERIDAADGAYDAVFDFAILHHVPSWRKAVSEIARVLKPGGRFYFEEVTRHALQRRSYRILFDHPDRDRFSGAELISNSRGTAFRSEVTFASSFSVTSWSASRSNARVHRCAVPVAGNGTAWPCDEATFVGSTVSCSSCAGQRGRHL